MSPSSPSLSPGKPFVPMSPSSPSLSPGKPFVPMSPSSPSLSPGKPLVSPCPQAPCPCPQGSRWCPHVPKLPVPVPREAVGVPMFPSSPSLSPGKPFVPMSPSSPSLSPGKPFVPKAAGPALPREEEVTLEPELEEALANATEAEMCDIAAILGMYTLMSNKQYYDAICSGNICNTEGINSVVQPDRYRPVPDEPPNPTDVAETLRRLQDNDPELQDVNLNNIKDIPVATRTNDLVANAVAEMLEQNRSLQSLNLESNFITSAGMLRLLAAIGHCPTLSELRVDNQCQRMGDTVEMAMAATLEQCPSLLRFGYTFSQQGPRARAAAALTRNSELRRQQKKS
uniref:Tropomodulin 4 n=1 Tax=Taeniopygia guttata TaxID=59729 RepID=H1A492_TAEGU